jgi:hypothetical protein
VILLPVGWYLRFSLSTSDIRNQKELLRRRFQDWLSHDVPAFFHDTAANSVSFAFIGLVLTAALIKPTAKRP